MTDEELADALDGLSAYDDGSTDSGIHDESLRARCIARLHEMSGQKVDGYMVDAGTLFLTRMMRDHYFSEEALKQGYSVEDAKGFIEWLGDRMEYDL